ncbi:carboxypeptidase regulatory-like domain-containing protein, partial [Pyxidicoccus sp. 3LG]
PPPGARLVGPEGQDVALAPDGRFTVARLPAWRTSRFNVQVVPSGSGRPVAREWSMFDFTPEARASEAEVTWRVPVFRWLVLRMDAFTRGQLQARARRPYPVFVLQRRDAEGRWATRAAEVFHDEEAGMAVSLLEPGTYRVLAAASPYEVHASTSAELGGDGAERFVTVRVPSPLVCPWQCLSLSMGQVGRIGADSSSAGGLGSLPPARGRTDAEGRLRLGRVLAESLHLEVEADGHAPWTGEAASDCHATGVVEVRL